MSSGDPLVDIFFHHRVSAPIPPVAAAESIIPGMSLDEECQCLDALRKTPVTWKVLPNGMTIGEFAYVYVYHFRRRRNFSAHGTK